MIRRRNHWNCTTTSAWLLSQTELGFPQAVAKQESEDRARALPTDVRSDSCLWVGPSSSTDWQKNMLDTWMDYKANQPRGGFSNIRSVPSDNKGKHHQLLRKGDGPPLIRALVLNWLYSCWTGTCSLPKASTYALEFEIVLKVGKMFFIAQSCIGRL